MADNSFKAERENFIVVVGNGEVQFGFLFEEVQKHWLYNRSHHCQPKLVYSDERRELVWLQVILYLIAFEELPRYEPREEVHWCDHTLVQDLLVNQ